MADNSFDFKQFSIQQERCAMKVGTDSVLLGAWVHLPDCGKILDIGTGTGILSLMAAQRTLSSHITALEIDTAASLQARENIERSPWHDRITIVNDDFTRWAVTCHEEYDCIISNPPYFEQSLLSPDTARSVARHTTALGYAHIFDLTRRIIKPHGCISLVLPHAMYKQANETAQLYGWGATRMTLIHTTLHKSPKRILCQWQQHHSQPCLQDILSIRNSEGQYSTEYIELTGDFYLHL